VKPNINISTNDEFEWYCKTGHLKVAKLLLQHETQNYYIFVKKNKIQIKKICNKKQQIAKQI
jgi:hypothetical protein